MKNKKEDARIMDKSPEEVIRSDRFLFLVEIASRTILLIFAKEKKEK